MNNLTLLDGAFGTRIWAKTGESKPVWMYNILRPDVIREVTAEYVAAGAQIVQANTFGANRISVEKSSDYSVEDVVKAAVRIAREAVQGTSVRVGLSAGPLTVMMEPYGDLEEDEAAEIYDEIFRFGIEEGADLIQLETFIDLNMLCVAAKEAKKYGFDNAETSGSAIVMSLNDDSKEYASRWKIEELIKRYSDHIAFPIYLHYEKNEYDDKGNVKSTENKVDQVNSASALWKRSKSELKAEDYNEFYKTIGHDGQDPLHYVHTHAEGTQEYTTLFYVPQVAPFDMYQADYKSGVKLYVKRVFITDDDRELLPAYLRFVRGVIDSEDLPLNVSREILQQNRILENIRNASIKKLLSEFKKLGEAADKAKKTEEANRSDDEKKAIEKWNKFVTQFNRPMKEGLYSDYANRDEIAEIVRFKSTDASGTGDGNYTSFADYVQRMKPEQKAIYYITGSDEKNLRANPLLKAYVNKGFEVLVLDDDIDEIVIGGYGKYKDFELKAVNRSGSDEDLGVDKEEAKKKEEEFKPVTEKLQKALGEKVKEVKLSKTLSGENPSCIVVDENDPSWQMVQMMKAMGQQGPEMKPILEVNGDHPILAKVKNSEDEAFIADAAEVLLDQALLIAGVDLKEPALFVKALNNLLSK